MNSLNLFVINLLFNEDFSIVLFVSISKAIVNILMYTEIHTEHSTGNLCSLHESRDETFIDTHQLF